MGLRTACLVGLLILGGAAPGCGLGSSIRLPADMEALPPDLSSLFPAEDLAARPPDLLSDEPDASEPPDLQPDPCVARSRIIYAIDQDNMLRGFDPTTMKFINIGFLLCPAEQGATPFSMGVDHNAVAWVLYNSGEIFLVDTQTAACKASAFVPNQGDFTNFGMGFVADKKGQVAAEHLYLAGVANMQLGVMDPVKLTIGAVGPLGGNPELTGTGGAALYGFFPDENTPRVSLLDKATGLEGQSYPLANLKGQALAWAFAFWGGDFWIFLQRLQDASTHVWRLDGATGKVIDVVPNTGFVIVGAGVSVCAPTGPSH